MLIASNQSLAEFNLTKEPELESGKERICEMYKEAEKLYKSVIDKANIISKYCISFYIKYLYLSYYYDYHPTKCYLLFFVKLIG